MVYIKSPLKSSLWMFTVNLVIKTALIALYYRIFIIPINSQLFILMQKIASSNHPLFHSYRLFSIIKDIQHCWLWHATTSYFYKYSSINIEGN